MRKMVVILQNKNSQDTITKGNPPKIHKKTSVGKGTGREKVTKKAITIPLKPRHMCETTKETKTKAKQLSQQNTSCPETPYKSRKTKHHKESEYCLFLNSHKQQLHRSLSLFLYLSLENTEPTEEERKEKNSINVSKATSITPYFYWIEKKMFYRIENNNKTIEHFVGKDKNIN